MRIARSTNTKNSDASAGGPSTKVSIPDSDGSSKLSQAPFKIGDYVRCAYAEDGVDYEARIIAIENDLITIKYIGYDNNEIVDADALVPSWGKKARKKQQLTAAASMTALPAADETVDAVTRPMKQNDGRQQFERFRSSMMIPPPPPMPPMLDEMTEDSEHMSAMLMSWYMSGYYTGLYQGLKQQKQHRSGKLEM